MNYSKRTCQRLVSWAALAAAGLGSQAWAQDANDPSDPGDIVVTARRVEEKLQDVPISMSVYNQGQLSNLNISSSTDLATYTPSLTLNSRYGPEKGSFAIRGFSQDLNTLPTVGVYFADVVAPRQTSQISPGGNGAGPGSMFDLENVQVLKGPQGTLFGRNTTGGTVLLVPRRPSDKLEGYVEGTLGNYDARRVEAVLNLPLADTFKVRLGIDRYKRDGYIHNQTDIGPKDFSNIDYFAARLSILAELTPDLENYTIATYSDSDVNGISPKLLYCNRGTIPGSVGADALTRVANCAEVDRMVNEGYGYYDTDNFLQDPYHKRKVWQIINTTTWRVSDSLTVKNIASYGEAKEKYIFNLIGDQPPYPLAQSYPGPNRGQGNQWTYTEELQLQGRAFDGRLTWQAGGYLERSKPLGTQESYIVIFSDCGGSAANVHQFRCDPLTLQFPTFSFPVGNIQANRMGYSYRSTGLYAQATYELTEQFSITAGIRNTWDWTQQTQQAITVTPSLAGPVGFACPRAETPANPTTALLATDACTRTFTEKSSRPTWLIDLDYKPTEDILLYAKYARGYRGGGVNESNAGFETWKPEIVDNYEIGAKLTFRGAVSGTFNISGFWNEFKDQQTQVFIFPCQTGQPGCTNPAPVQIAAIQNVGKARLRGVEVDASVLFFDSLRFDVGYAYLDAVVTGGNVPNCDQTRFDCANAIFLTKGDRLTYAPKNRITLTGTYTLPVDESIGRISFGATFTHTGRQITDYASFPAFDVGAIPFNGSTVQPTSLLNLNLNWKDVAGKPFDLALFATNVTKEKYYIASAGGLGTTGAEGFIFGEPRMYGIRLKVRFGD